MAEYIEREALIADLEKSVVISCKTEKLPQAQKVLSKIMNCIKEQPTADVSEVRYGHWFKTYEGGSKYGCSVCFTQADLSKQHKNYCSKCGAKMDKE